MPTHEELYTPVFHDDGSIDHYCEAVRYLSLAEGQPGETAETLIAKAQVHATLYTADGRRTVYASNGG